MHKPGPALEKYIATVQKWRWGVIAFWGLCLVVGGLKGINLLKAVKLAFDPPSNSPSAIAQDKLTGLFPEAAASSPIALVMHRVSDESILGSDVEQFSASLETYVMNYVNTTVGAEHMVKPGGVQGVYTSSIHLGSKSPFIGGDNSSWTIININILIDLKEGLSGKAPTDFCKALMEEVPKLSNASFAAEAVEIKMTGLLVFGIEVLKGTEHDLLVMDGTAFPLALIV